MRVLLPTLRAASGLSGDGREWGAQGAGDGRLPGNVLRASGVGYALCLQVLAYQGTPVQLSFSDPVNFSLWVLQRMGLLLFQCAAAYASVTALAGFTLGTGLSMPL